MERKGAYYTEELGEKVAAAARPDKISTIYVIYSTNFPYLVGGSSRKNESLTCTDK
jgi:hypothetical protein